MPVEKFRAFYPPTVAGLPYDLVDAKNQNALPSGAILILQLNEDGTRSVISEKKNRTTAEQVIYTAASKHLEFKYDG